VQRTIGIDDQSKEKEIIDIVALYKQTVVL
jgi:hypothetical protein